MMWQQQHCRVGTGSSKRPAPPMLRCSQPLSRLAAQQARQLLVAAQASQQGAISSAAHTTQAAAEAAAAVAERARQASQRWSEQSTVYFSNYPLDRAAEARQNEAQVMAWFNAPDARLTPVNGARILVHQEASATAANSSNGSSSTNGTASTPPQQQQAVPQPVWVSPASELTCAVNAAVPPLFLGLDRTTGAPHFAVQVAAAEVEALAGSYAARWVSARNAGPEMSRSDAALMAVASGLAQWNLDVQYHGASGSSTTPSSGGFSRKCASSGRSLYPRIDPAIITLVTGGSEWCLLGRKHEWPRGRYSTLAGFLEIGESLEQALAREVLEESGVEVSLPSARYVASQPWPFPRSLMVGFYAAAAAAAAAGAGDGSDSSSSSSSSSNAAGPVELLSHQGRMAMMDSGIKPAEVAAVLGDCRFLQPPVPQEGEMEDVRWFHRDWLAWALLQGSDAAPGGFMIPGEYSLAYRLITGWLQQQQQQQQQQQGLQEALQETAMEAGPNSSSSSSWLGNQVPQVEIDEGVFKYVLLRLTDSSSGRSKLLVRGAAAAAYHNHILQHTKGQLQKLCPQGTLQLDVLGGGRIEHYADHKVISVYGYSAAFGPAVHEVTAALLQRWYPFYDASSITWSYEGY